LPRAYWVLWTGTLVNRAGTFVEPFAVLYLTTQRGFSPTQAGIALVFYGLGAAGSQLLGGWAADRIGRRTTLVAGLVAAAAALLLLGAARSLSTVCVAALLVGVSGDLYRPASAALVADLVSPIDRPRAYALLFWAVNLGFSVAAVTAGLLAEVSYTLLFVGDALTCLAFAAVVALGIRHDPPRPPPADPGSPGGFGTALRDPLVLGLVALTLLSACVYFQNAVTLPLAVTADGLSPAVYGAIMAVNGVLIVLLQPVAIRLLRGYDRARLLGIGSGLIGLGFFLTTYARTPLAYGATVVVWTIGEIVTAGLAASLVADLAPPEARGRYQAVWGTSFGVAALIAPAAGTWTYQYLGPTVLWVGCLVAGLVGAAGFSWLSPRFRARTLSASSSPR
jgi:MFS family permease